MTHLAHTYVTNEIHQIAVNRSKISVILTCLGEISTLPPTTPKELYTLLTLPQQKVHSPRSCCFTPNCIFRTRTPHTDKRTTQTNRILRAKKPFANRVRGTTMAVGHLRSPTHKQTVGRQLFYIVTVLLFLTALVSNFETLKWYAAVVGWSIF